MDFENIFKFKFIKSRNKKTDPTNTESKYAIFQSLLSIRRPTFRLTFWLTVILIFVILFVIVTVIGIYSLVDFKIHFEDKEKVKDFLLFTFAFIIGLCGNIIGSVIFKWVYERHYERQEKTKIDGILKIANSNLLSGVFYNLTKYENRYCKDYTIDAKLKSHNNSDNLFKCTVKYEYKKILKNRELIFLFERILLENDIKEVPLEYTGNYFEHEFHYRLDERGLTGIDKTDFKLNYIAFCQDGHDSIRLTPELVENGNDIVYKANLPENVIVENNLITIFYEVEYIVENESYVYFTLELPTKSAKCYFDYSAVSDSIDFNSFDLLSSHTGPTPLHYKDQTRIILVKDDWILPRSSFCFVWYKK